MTSHHEQLILHSGQSTQSYCKCSINLCLATPHSTHLTHDTSVFTEIILGIAIWRLKCSPSNISPTLNRKDPIYLLTNREHFTMQVYSSIKEATKRPDKPVTQGSYPQFQVFLASIFFFCICKHWRRKKPGKEYDESYTTGLLHKQANLLPHLLLKPNQIKRKKKLGYSYTLSPEFLDVLTLSRLMWVARVKV